MAEPEADPVYGFYNRGFYGGGLYGRRFGYGLGYGLGYRRFGGYRYWKRSADAEPESDSDSDSNADSDPYLFYGGLGYTPYYGSHYNRAVYSPYTTYSTYGYGLGHPYRFIGKRSADSEPESDPWYGYSSYYRPSVYGYSAYRPYSIGYSAGYYGYPGYVYG